MTKKPWIKNILDLARNISKCFNILNRKIISKDTLDVINDQNIQRKLNMINKEADIFESLFMEDGDTIYITLL